MIEDLLLETKGQLRANKIKPGIVAGQNFLVSAAVLQDIVRAADIQSTEAVLEIGPGLGVLTKELAVRARQVLAIEYDRNLLPVLEKIKANHSNFTFINDDILRVKNQLIADCLGGDYRVIANIPYQITAKIINKFLTFSPRPKDLLLLVQKEVAERIVAGAGQLSKLAVSVQFYARPKIVRLVSRDCFWPAPAVDSALLKIVLDNKYSDILTKRGLAEKFFWSVVRIGFAGRRKTLLNNLSSGLHQAKAVILEILSECALDKNIRAQELTIDNWINLVEKLER